MVNGVFEIGLESCQNYRGSLGLLLWDDMFLQLNRLITNATHYSPPCLFSASLALGGEAAALSETPRCRHRHDRWQVSPAREVIS